MPKWQFAEVTVEYGGPIMGVQAELVWWHPDGNPKTRKDKVGKIMTDLGNEGWDLVSSSIITGSAWGNRRVVHMFKRPAD